MPPVDGLQVVLLLFQLENVLHEKLLQILVGEIDAKLLEAVGGEVLKAENVKHTNGVAGRRLGFVDGLVDFVDDVDEETPVDALGQGVSDVHRLLPGQGGHHRLAGSENCPSGQGVDQRLLADAEDCCNTLHISVLRNLRCIQIVCKKYLNYMFYNVLKIIFLPITEALYLMFPVCKSAASSFNMSQISWSEKSSTFIADLMSAYSAASSLPSQIMLPPYKAIKFVFLVLSKKAKVFTPVRYLYWEASSSSSFLLSSPLNPANMQ